MRTWTSVAPASRTMRTILRLVVPRTMESSTRTTRLPSSSARTGLSLSFTPKSRMDCSRLDKRAADVVIANQAHAKGQAGFERIADRGGHAGVGHGHDEIGVGGLLAREQAAQHFAAAVDGAAKDQAIGARKIDVLENAVLVAASAGAKWIDSTPLLEMRTHLAGLDFANVFRADQIERAGFRSDHPGVAESAEAERAEAARIANGVKLVARENQQRVGAFDLIEGVGERALQIVGGAARDQVHDRLRYRWWSERSSRDVRACGGSLPALVRLPLCAEASLPLLQSMTIGWALMSEVSPAVE